MQKNKSSIFIILALFLLIIAGICYAAFSGRIPENDSNTIGNTAGNLNNNGLFCETKEGIYFANSYDSNALYFWNTSNGKMKKINNNTCYSINVAGNYLYFCMTTNSKNSGLGYLLQTSGLYRTKKNGKSAACLTADPCYIAAVAGNNVIYQQDAKGGAILVKQNLDKTGKEVVADYVINPSSIHQGTIYYNGVEQGNHYLYTLNTTTNDIACIYEKDMWNPIYQDGYIYYMDIHDNYRLHRYNIYEQNDERLSDDRIDFFNIYNNIIFYAKAAGEDSALIRMQADGSNQEVVMSGIFHNINITSGYTFFQSYDDPVTTYMTSTYGNPQVYEFMLAKEAVKD